jgi:DNA-directed RNA polymerase subunit RPC12/RpoP
MPPIGVSCQEVNGVCQITPPSPTISTCTDSDGGMNPYVKGTVTYQGQTYTDTCVAANTLKEYYCDNGIKQEHLSTCQNGYTCQDGACVATDTSLQVQILKPATGEVLTANAPYEIKWSLINPTSNEIQTEDRIRILFDQSGNFTNWTTVVSDLPLTQTSYLWNTPNITCSYCSLRLGVYRPSNGYWVKYAQIPIYLKQITPPSPTISTCTDSDGGMNPYVKGTVTYQGQTYTDTCVAANTLKEYYCDNGIKQEHLSTCQNGYTCQDGACVATDTSLQVQILKPATGEVLTANAPYEIKWSLINPTSNEIQTEDRIRILFDQSGNFTNWTTVVSDLPLTQTSYLWNTPNITCSYCSLRLGVYRPSNGYWVKYAQIPIYLKQITPQIPEPIPLKPISSSSDILMDALNKLSASLMSLMELLKH